MLQGRHAQQKPHATSSVMAPFVAMHLGAPIGRFGASDLGQRSIDQPIALLSRHSVARVQNAVILPLQRCLDSRTPLSGAEQVLYCRFDNQHMEERQMPILLWLLGIPIPIIILLVLLWH
jgi:hypothetical protein